MNLGGCRVLVTGGAGFIGSHLVERLLEKGASVVVYDRFDSFYPGKEANVTRASQSQSFKLVKGSILDLERIDSATAGADVVFHLAGQAGIGFSIEHPREVNEVNVDGTLGVLTLARKHGVKRFVNASSSSVFGEPAYLPMDENHPTNPTSPYGVSKLAAEQYAVAFAKVYGTYTVSLRYFSVYGPRGRPDQVIHRFAKEISEGRAPVIRGDGSHTRDFTYVSDVVEATILAAESEGLAGEVFNIGFGARTSISDLAARITRLLSPEGAKLSPVHQQEGRGEFPHTQADNDKAKRLLGWRPRIGLDEGLRLFVEWFRSPARVGTLERPA